MFQTSKNVNAISARFAGCIVLHRVGDFYELFNQDARDAAACLGLTLTLTTRNKASETPLPMAGFPYHQLSSYLPKLRTIGRPVAIVESETEATIDTHGLSIVGGEVFQNHVRKLVLTSHAAACSAAARIASNLPEVESEAVTIETTSSAATSEELASEWNELAEENETPLIVQKWASRDLGPRQAKKVAETISRFLFHCKFTRVITDHGENEVLEGMTTAQPCRDGIARHNAIHAKHGGTVTAKNHAAIVVDFLDAWKSVKLPTRDERTTPEQRAEHAARMIQLDAERVARQSAREISVAEHVAELRAKYPGAVSADKYKSGAAHCAANLRNELKAAFPGVKFSVTSDTFSMGDSVDIRWTLGPCAEDVEKISRKYQDGHFDGMTDCHESDNTDFGRAVEIVLGRAKYVHTHRETGDAMEKLAPLVCKHYGVECDRGLNTILHGDCNELSRIIYSQIFRPHSFPAYITADDITGIEHVQDEKTFCWTWKILYPVASSPDVAESPANGNATQTTGATSTAFSVKKHYHDKRRVDFWLVVPANRLERDEYDALLTAARSAGGWQSRKWGKTPSGFGFASEELARSFVASLAGPDASTETSETAETLISTPAREKSPGTSNAAETVNKATAEKLRTLADGMTDTVAAKLAPMSQNWTHKRGREHASKIIEGERLQRTQTALYAIADATEAGTLPPVLRSVRTKTAVYELMRNLMKPNNSTGEYYDSGEPGNTTPEALALRQLVEASRTEEHKQAQEIAKRAQEITRAENALRTAKVPGFFPSPPAVCAQLISGADIPEDVPPGFRVLEPEAGIGSVCSAIVEQTNVKPEQITGVELRPSMVAICEMKGFNTIDADFLECTPEQLGTFDRVLMNPPFENGLDADHVRHAFRFLKPGGILSAIVGAGIMSRSDRKAQDFRTWLEDVGGESEQLEAGLFTGAESFRQTGVSVCRVVICAPGDSAEFERVHQIERDNEREEMDTLEGMPQSWLNDPHADFPELAFL